MEVTDFKNQNFTLTQLLKALISFFYPYKKNVPKIFFVFFLTFPFFASAEKTPPEEQEEYLSWVWKGEYQKAIQILEKKLSQAPSQDVLWYDLGNIYFLGLNQLEKAERYFQKSLKMNPSSVLVYPSLGYLYEKRGLQEQALHYYQKAIEVAPIEGWTDFARSHIAAIALAQKGELAADWLLIGPFPDSLGIISPGDILKEKITENQKLIYQNHEYAWNHPIPKEGQGFVSLNELFTPNDFVSALCLTYAYSPKEQSVLINIGNDDEAVVWLNQKQLSQRLTGGALRVDLHKIAAKLEPGWNEIVIQIFDKWGDWGFYFRITSPKNEPASVVYSPTRDPTVILALKEKTRKENFQIFIRSSFSICLSLIVILSFLYLLKKKREYTQLKNLFFDGVSHELMTPLASMKACLQTSLRPDVSSEQQREYLQYFEKEIQRLENLVGNLLHFSRLRKNQNLSIHLKAQDVKEILIKTLHLFELQVKDPQLKIKQALANEDFRASLNEELFTIALLNILHNAYKYSPTTKSITVSLFKKNKMIQLMIQDHGMGIASSHLRKIFKPFYRVGESHKRGVGLGLALTKTIIKKHHAQIRIQSNQGKGTTISILLKEA